ncbi:MAG: hypothetical protein BWK73_25495 [Thiothrix lacustris]|uniref:Uncharacterized protein n=1 Tax=Thiothrix lacustris TaxID=525917 RepID=A0A1Y1QLN6_9GAMM|nr:MAG: hypothetical protein BWK73_25495 [Thiothrix lacustris]
MPTPYHPSKRARSRVKDQLPVPKTCNCCGSTSVSARKNSVVYRGKEYGAYPWIYLCEDCRAYVGIHRDTDIPLGTLADSRMRAARKRVKPPFEQLFDSDAAKLSRAQAYAVLAEEMGIPASQCHFGMFTVDQCNQALVAVDRIWERLV